MREDAGVLIPGGDEPVGGEGGGETAADDEAEVARASRGDGAVHACKGELICDGVGSRAGVGQRAAELLTELVGCEASADWSGAERGEPVGGVALHFCQERGCIFLHLIYHTCGQIGSRVT